MALSLNAEQKNLLKLFKIEEQYVIPTYQRPYSWEHDHCLQLFNDIMSAFVRDEDYFIGNIIIARDLSNQDSLELVDGQQRVVTLVIMLKILSMFYSELKVLTDLIRQENWEGNDDIPRIKSDIFECDDNKNIILLLNYDKDSFVNLYENSKNYSGKIQERKLDNKIILNALYFYDWFTEYSSRNNNLKDFITFLLKQVYLLPIELSGNSHEEASEKALLIFETINNRGMNLEDADIFKARLYNKAKKQQAEKEFIALWSEFKIGCANNGLSIDEMFRYYSHIIRGREGITSGEIKLRDFFVNTVYSPLEQLDFKEVMNELFSISNHISFINKMKYTESNVSKWLQILDHYTNLYPKYAIVSYLHSKPYDDLNFERFVKAIIRFVFYRGSTSTVKFEIYQIIKQIYFNYSISDYYQDYLENDFFDYLGRLRKGYALLAYYNSGYDFLANYSIERLLTRTDLYDLELLNKEWEQTNNEDILNNFGNYIVVAKNLRYQSLEDKMNLVGINNINDITPQFIENRNLQMKHIITNFFLPS